MKILLINGSTHTKGCTYTALTEAAKIFEAEGIDWELISLGPAVISDCMARGKCRELGACVLNNDPVNEILEKAKEADAFVFGTPVYYAHPSARLLSLLDRLFYAGCDHFRHKPGFAVASARRAGTTASVDVLNKYFTFAEMPLVSSTYWNVVHGADADQVVRDLEGIQTVKNAALNMCWLLKCIELGKKQGIHPPATPRKERTNFIR